MKVFTPIKDFSAENGRLSFRGRTLTDFAAEAPLFQFEVGGFYLLFLAGDLYENEIFDIRLFNSQCQLVEMHSVPRPSTEIAPNPWKIVTQTSNTTLSMQLDLLWIVTFDGKKRLRIRDAVIRLRNGWLPSSDVSKLVWPSYLAIRLDK